MQIFRKLSRTQTESARWGSADAFAMMRPSPLGDLRDSSNTWTLERAAMADTHRFTPC